MKKQKELYQVIHDITLSPPNTFTESVSVPKSVMFEADDIEDFHEQLDKYLIENNVFSWEYERIR